MTVTRGAGVCATLFAPAGRMITILSVLLAAQLLLAGALRMGERSYQPVEPAGSILTCDFKTVTRVVLEDKTGTTKSKITFLKNGNSWILPEYYDFRASAHNINKLFDTLKSLKKGAPVTTTSSSAEHLRVSPANFERAVHVYDDNEKETSLYLGSAPSLRTIYARSADSSNIYTVDIADYELSTRPADWIDREAVALDPADMTGIDVGDIKARKVEGRWTLETQDRNVVLRGSVAQHLVDTIAGVNVESVLGTAHSTIFTTGAPVLACSVTLKNGDVLTYSYSKPAEGSFHVLKISGKNWCMAVDNRLVNRLKQLSTESLLAQEAAAAASDKQQR